MFCCSMGVPMICLGKQACTVVLGGILMLTPETLTLGTREELLSSPLPAKTIHLVDTSGRKLLHILAQKCLLTRLFGVSLMDLGKLFWVLNWNHSPNHLSLWYAWDGNVWKAAVTDTSSWENSAVKCHGRLLWNTELDLLLCCICLEGVEVCTAISPRKRKSFVEQLGNICYQLCFSPPSQALTSTQQNEIVNSFTTFAFVLRWDLT